MAKKAAKDLKQIVSATTLVEKLNTHYGAQVITTGSQVPNVHRIPWDIPAVDYVTGGGNPLGRVLEIYGPESSGKTYLALILAAKAQKYCFRNHVPNAFTAFETSKRTVVIKGGASYDVVEVSNVFLSPEAEALGHEDWLPKRVGWIDAEGCYDPIWAEMLGIDNETLFLSKPDKGSHAIDIAASWIANSEFGLVVIDSVSAVVSDQEDDASMEDEQMAVNARFWNKATRKMQSAINKNPDKDCAVLLINRTYSKVGFVMGNPEVVANGSGIRYAKSISLEVKAYEEIKGKDAESGEEVVVGRNIRVMNKKNKTSRPFLKATYYFSLVDDGIVKAYHTNVEGQIIDLALKAGIVKRSGAWYSYGKVKVSGYEPFVEKVIKSGLAPRINKELMDKAYKLV